MDPFTIAFLVMTIASMAMTAVSAKQQQKANDDIAEANQDRADRDAQQLESDRHAEAGEERKEAKRRRASIENMYAGSGVLIDGTSAGSALAEQAAVDELSVLNRDRVSNSQAEKIRDQGRMGIWEASLKNSAVKSQAIGSIVKQGASGVMGTKQLMNSAKAAKAANAPATIKG